MSSSEAGSRAYRRWHWAVRHIALGRPRSHSPESGHGGRGGGALVSVLLVVLLGACGFALRGPQQLPFPTLALNFPLNSQLGIELSRNIRTSSQTRIVPDASQAAAVLDLIGEAQDKQVVVFNAQGRAIEYTLIYRLRFRLRDAQGREVIESTELQVHRDITSNDSQRLSKESEEELLRRDMRTDLVQQLLRRLAAAKPFATTDATAQ